MIPRICNPLKYIEKNQSLFLFGPRGTGKTALISSLIEKFKFKVSYDFLTGGAFRKYIAHPEIMAEELTEAIKKLPKEETLLVLVDEVQKIPAVLDEVHSLLEKYKKQICFILTGGSARKLKRSGANLLASRAIVMHLYPLNSREVDIQLSKALQYGTLPKIYLEEGLEIERLEAYVNTYLKEEIQEEALVRQTDKFIQFLEVAGQMNGEPINFTKLGKSCSVTYKTAMEYYSILEDTLLVTRLNGWEHSIRKQLLKAPKFYFFDCGVLNSINGELRTELKPSSFRYGKLFENWIIQEIVRLNSDLNLGLRLNYWRDEKGKEVDLIISQSTAKPLIAIEIKSAVTPDENEVTALLTFKKDYPKILPWCLCQCPRAYKKNGIEFLPWQEGLKRLQQINNLS